MVDEGGLRRRLGRLVWAVGHFPAVMRRAISAVYVAEDARARVLRLDGDGGGRVGALEAGAVSALSRLDAMEAAAGALSATDGDLGVAIGGLSAAVAGLGHTSANLVKTASGLVGTTAGLAADVAAVAGAVARVGEEVAAVRREVMFQQRRLSGFAAAGGRGVPAGVASGRHDSLYAAFEDVFRGSRADIKGRLGVYLERLTLAGAGRGDAPVLDIGCGRGEWIELLGEHGLSAYGIDSNGIMVERSLALGLDARHDDLLSHLRGLGDSSRSAVTAFHVVEHLPFDVMVDFFDEALRVLTPGGVLIVETPNPETVRVGASTFYNDPTHRNPLMPEPLGFVVGHRGFEAVEVLRLHPFTQGLLEADTADARLLNRVLFGAQDYAIVARRG